MLKSQLCTADSLTSPEFLAWAEELRPAWDEGLTGRPLLLHRKIWEWIYILRALEERGRLRPGQRGLGFGVGTEALAAVLAARGCHVLATDLDTAKAAEAGWDVGGQHASSLDDLNQAGLCPPEEFVERVSFRHLDMNRLPADLSGFDFLWSSCALEHLGSLELSVRFIIRSLECLRPGGTAVHTTEFNLSSNVKTLESGDTVLFRKQDLERLSYRLHRSGHRMKLALRSGSTPADTYVDVPPYGGTSHLRTRLAEYTITSLGLVIEKRGGPIRAQARRWAALLDRTSHAMARLPRHASRAAS